ncbi:MAG: hypothetical protein FWC34_03925 [Bacteroidetes bacterium]|nr:hypothetical protein [Bacteroidota bacterium]MCL2303410.1 hypothetical protein [Lentimicrobiaceae bacterium]
MKDLFCLSERAIQVIREPAVKWKILYAIESTDIANRISEVQYSPVPPQELERIRKEYTNKAERYMSSVVETLKRYSADYTAYFTFAGDNAPPSKHIRRDNTNKKIFLA